MDTVEAVKCDYCDELIEAESDDYFKFVGGFFKRDESMVLGEDGIVCKKAECLRRLIEEHTGIAIKRKEINWDDVIPKPKTITPPEPPDTFVYPQVRYNGHKIDI